MKNKIKLAITSAVAIIAVTLVCSCGVETPEKISDEYAGLKHNDNYQLEQMTVLSRHNIRPPLTTADSKVNKNSSHEWHEWSSQPGELSLLGGQCETMMGQYFNQYLVQEKLIKENWIPQGDEVKFYSNNYQRTVATAKYFAVGMLPVANVQIQHNAEVGNTADNLFIPIVRKSTDAFKAQANKEVDELFDNGGKSNIHNVYKDNQKLIEDVVGAKNAITEAENDTLVLNEGKAASSKGSIQDMTSYADALIMQYYEEPDNAKAAFGKNISKKEWKKIGDVLSAGITLALGSHIEGVHTMQPMMKELLADIKDTNRKFTFLCGHDSTVSPVLSALNVQWESFPYTPTDNAPIGEKLVMSKFKNAAGEEFMRLELVYESSDQIRNREVIDKNNPPVCFPLKFKDMQANEDGFYKLSDVEARINKTISEFEN